MAKYVFTVFPSKNHPSFYIILYKISPVIGGCLKYVIWNNKTVFGKVKLQSMLGLDIYEDYLTWYSGFLKKKQNIALPGVAQWIECPPVNQMVAGSIPSQGTCLGCGPGPQ